MAQALTQAEIDALLTSGENAPAGRSELETGSDHRAPVVYDFKHPNRVSKDQIRTLENIHNSFAGNLGSALSAILRTVVDVDLTSVDQLTYSEYIASLSAPACTYRFAMAPLEGFCVLGFSPTLAFAFVDRMFGGHGKTTEAQRELTGIERSVMDIISARGLKELVGAWRRIAEVEIAPKGFESTPQFLQIVPPGETVIVTTFRVKMLEAQGDVTLCYPYLTLEPIVEKLSGQHWINAATRKAVGSERAVIEHSLGDVPGAVTAILARTQITMHDALGLQVGDVLVCDTRVWDPAEVHVGAMEKYLARPGLRGRHRAVQIIGHVPTN